MKSSEVREILPDELQEELRSLQRRFFDVRSQAVTEKLEDPSLLTKIKRDIARIKTIMRERELAEEQKQAYVLDRRSEV